MAPQVLADPIGVVVDLVSPHEPGLNKVAINAAVTSIAGGRAKRRRLAQALLDNPTVLINGRSPAPRVIAELLIALRNTGAASISAPVCAECGKQLRTFERRGEHWYCGVCGPAREPCAACGEVRPVSCRDRAGQPRCAQCPPDEERDPTELIVDLVNSADPTLPAELVVEAVTAAVPRPRQRQQLAWALQDRPDLLTGAGAEAPIPSVLRLIDRLCDTGARMIIHPACPRCDRVRHLHRPIEGQWICRTCTAKARAQSCFRCGAVREAVSRDEHGKPLCANCFTTDPANQETCVHCGRRRPVDRRTPDGPLCSRCPVLPLLTCSICGQTTPCGNSRATGQPWCPACQRRSAPCSVCARHTAITSGTLAAPLCADCTAPAAWVDCPTCSDPEYPSPGQCSRCLINKRLNELMGPSTGSLPPGLQALRRDIATAEHHITAMRWLTKPSIAPVLSDLAAGRVTLTHQGLDELPPSQPLAHLRQTLVAVGALPARDEIMVSLEAFLAELLASQPDTERRQLLHRYLIWNLVRRLRHRNNAHPATRQQSKMVRRLARGAVKFLDWLDEHDLTMSTLRQADLDHWAADDSATYREEAGRLIRWARANKLTTAHLSATSWNGPAQILDHQHRWATARRLLHDDNLKPDDRLAGLLVLLYAQGATTISAMTADQIQADDRHARLFLGQVPIHLPEPVATLARVVLTNRKGHATIGARTPSPWLFPGGQPGRPISSARLTQRLHNLGIRPGQARSTALFQLTTEVPAAILARTLGIHTDVAVAWQRHSAGDWTSYAAEVSRRNSRHSDSSNT
jgi:hypothetical protein